MEIKTPTIDMILAQSVRSKYMIVLDENLEMLKPGLKDAGLKVLSVPKGYSDEQVFELAETGAVLTRNVKDFTAHAVAKDFDIIDVSAVKFLDNEATRKNQTVQKIIKALRESKLFEVKGNFHLTILDDGSFKLKVLTV